jgi:hypothetical protein
VCGMTRLLGDLLQVAQEAAGPWIFSTRSSSARAAV